MLTDAGLLGGVKARLQAGLSGAFLYNKLLIIQLLQEVQSLLKTKTVKNAPFLPG
jgi:hypothetical protein